MIESGRHKATVLDVEFGRSGNDNDQVAVRFELEDGERIVWWGYFSDAAVSTTMGAFEAMGWTPDRCDFGQVDSQPADFWNEVSLVIEHEEDQRTGEPRARVRWVNSLGGPMNKAPLEDKSKKALGAKMQEGQEEAPAGAVWRASA